MQSVVAQQSQQHTDKTRIVRKQARIWRQASARHDVQAPLVVVKGEQGARAQLMLMWETSADLLEVMGARLGFAHRAGRADVERGFEACWQSDLGCMVTLGEPAICTAYWSRYDNMVQTLLGDDNTPVGNNDLQAFLRLQGALIMAKRRVEKDGDARRRNEVITGYALPFG